MGKMFDWEPIHSMLGDLGLEKWATQLESLHKERTAIDSHGTLSKWMDAWEELPANGELRLGQSPTSHISIEGELQDQQRLAATLMQFHPWRKGPFRVFGVEIDTEWRSNWKWDRLSDVIDFQGKNVLDVGCGNGYYGWKMLEAGASRVLGCEPFLLYLAQFEIFRRYFDGSTHNILPIGDHEIPQGGDFDTALSMGVLYHRASPVDHLKTMAGTLKHGGELVLETLVIDEPGSQVLVPADRYAKMRNVWFLPSIDLLKTFLGRTGFRNIQVHDVSRTTPNEQRRTPWMTFESLSDFLDPSDLSRTIEGYPAPVRALLSATKR